MGVAGCRFHHVDGVNHRHNNFRISTRMLPRAIDTAKISSRRLGVTSFLLKFLPQRFYARGNAKFHRAFRLEITPDLSATIACSYYSGEITDSSPNDEL